MRIVCLSDTHAPSSAIIVPDGDVLIHSGDHTFQGTTDQIRKAWDWLNTFPHSHKVVIAGNHDFFFESKVSFGSMSIEHQATIQAFLEEYPGITYLNGSSVSIGSELIWGSPYTPHFYDWAFNFPYNDYASTIAAAHWEKIPAATTILVTHGPAAGILDRCANGDRPGCPALRKRIEQLSALKLHQFGHIHEGYGTAQQQHYLAINASICTAAYSPTNPPIVIDL
jgi:hypothetical protein